MKHATEAYYDDVIAPQLLALARDAREHGVNLLALCQYLHMDHEFQLDPIAETAHTIGTDAPQCFAFKLAARAAGCAGNVDALLIWLVRYAHKLPPGQNQSALLQILMEATKITRD